MKEIISIRKSCFAAHQHEWVADIKDTSFYVNKEGKKDFDLAHIDAIHFPSAEAATRARDTYLYFQEQDQEQEKPAEEIRTFPSGATRDTADNKLDYVKALSPIVLRRYVQYLDKHREQSDGSYRDFDNWKKGIDQDTYHSSGGRHFFDAWLLAEGYATVDNHGPVEIEDVLCAQLFNIMGKLHEILKKKVARVLSNQVETSCQSPAPMVVDREVCH